MPVWRENCQEILDSNKITWSLWRSYVRKSISAAENEKCWYLPHHGDHHPNKPGKIGAMFDLSAEFYGTSMNKALLSWADLASKIIVVSLRFREEQIAVTGDIEVMYHQVKVPDNQNVFYGFFGEKTTTPTKLLLIIKWKLMHFLAHHHHPIQTIPWRKLQQIMLINMRRGVIYLEMEFLCRWHAEEFVKPKDSC